MDMPYNSSKFIKPMSNLVAQKVDEGLFSIKLKNAYKCYNKTSNAIESRARVIRLGDGPFSFSNIYNKLIATGCASLAFMSDAAGKFKVSDFDLSYTINEFERSELVIEWIVEEKSCEDAKKSASYACASNSDCIYSKNGKGYRCKCKEGFAGNPYLQGCQGIYFFVFS
ncbi:conserved hypothetical protein [Ricinus communis]|uniref:EGF-like domain-containing protein n=1 Tax=Ricinus communis TaxID=3988 RepID=B9SNI6_RICCO|nr:conserved hypothetical protein [Ricinus communis]